jgi:hypothetical protein
MIGKKQPEHFIPCKPGYLADYNWRATAQDERIRQPFFEGETIVFAREIPVQRIFFRPRQPQNMPTHGERAALRLPSDGRSQDGSLFLSCKTLSFTIPRRFIPALSRLPTCPR